MTREHKLALVLGFGLLLFVGILVSDHFSAAQKRSTPDLAGTSMAQNPARQPEVNLQPLQANTPTVVSLDSEQATPGIYPVQPQGVAVVAQPEQASPVQEGAPHVIQQGETLYEICSRHYGNGNLWKDVLRANGMTEDDSRRLKNGSTIMLPPRAAFGGASMGDSMNEPGLSLPEPAVGGSYTVQEGDTLSRIAGKTLGSKARWKELADLNQDRIRNVNALKPGTVLRLPTN